MKIHESTPTSAGGGNVSPESTTTVGDSAKVEHQDTDQIDGQLELFDLEVDTAQAEYDEAYNERFDRLRSRKRLEIGGFRYDKTAEDFDSEIHSQLKEELGPSPKENAEQEAKKEEKARAKQEDIERGREQYRVWKEKDDATREARKLIEQQDVEYSDVAKKEFKKRRFQQRLEIGGIKYDKDVEERDKQLKQEITEELGPSPKAVKEEEQRQQAAQAAAKDTPRQQRQAEYARMLKEHDKKVMGSPTEPITEPLPQPPYANDTERQAAQEPAKASELASEDKSKIYDQILNDPEAVGELKKLARQYAKEKAVASSPDDKSRVVSSFFSNLQEQLKNAAQNIGLEEIVIDDDFLRQAVAVNDPLKLNQDIDIYSKSPFVKSIRTGVDAEQAHNDEQLNNHMSSEENKAILTDEHKQIRIRKKQLEAVKQRAVRAAEKPANFLIDKWQEQSGQELTKEQKDNFWSKIIVTPVRQMIAEAIKNDPELSKRGVTIEQIKTLASFAISPEQSKLKNILKRTVKA